jgi:hypothetical protein
VNLDWNDIAAPGLEGYILVRAIAGGPSVRLNADLITASRLSDTGLVNGTEYCYQVLAVTASSASPLSARVCARPGGTGVPRFVRGDTDASGSIDISDPLRLLGFLFLGEYLEGTDPRTIECLDAADVNDDGKADITDAIASLGFQFLGETPPAAPHPGCGTDPEPDESPSLGCVRQRPDCR